jgi:TetR/AcrR family transcriptional regulator, transcriptional repressor of bet genes
MPGLTPISTLRRVELRRAAYEVASRHGFHAMTIEQVARHSGVSKGMVHQYFANKQDLMEHAVRYAHFVYRKGILDRLKLAKTPSERLWSIVEGTFAPENFNPGVCRLWLTVFDALKHDQKLARLYRVLDKRSVTLTIATLKQLTGEAELEPVAYSIMALMDGLWALSATEPDVSREAALSIIAGYIHRNIPRFDMSVVSLPAQDDRSPKK